MNFSKYLTPQERIEAWKAGITYKLAEREILPSEFNSMCKQAEEGSAPWPLSWILWAAILSGGTLGVGSHLIDNAIGKSSVAVREKRRKREYMRDVVQRIKDELEAPDQENV